MSMRTMRWLSAFAGLLLVSGCAGYKLGPSNGLVAGEKSVQITPFSNETMEPRLGDEVTMALRRELQRDGTFHLATHGDADIQVSGVLTHFNRHELSFVPRDVLTVRDYRVSVIAHITARELSSGKVLLDRNVTNYTLVRIGSDLVSAERQAMPVLADDLAKTVTSLLADGAW